jgi:hypothetical protein
MAHFRILILIYPVYCKVSGHYCSSFFDDNILRVYKGVSKIFRTESITKYMLTFGITRWEATQMVMAAKLSRLTHRTEILLHLVQRAVPFAVLAPGGQSGNFWIHPRTRPSTTTKTIIIKSADWTCDHEKMTYNRTPAPTRDKSVGKSFYLSRC